MLFKRLAAEALGTFILVFAGTGAIVIDTVQHGAVSHVGVQSNILHRLRLGCYHHI